MSRRAITIPQHIIAQLGKTTDKELAKAANCSTAKICQLRHQRKIPAFNQPMTQGVKVPAVVPAANTEIIEVAPRIPDAVRRLFTEGKSTAAGVLIPFEVFAAAAMEALR
jgi:hypothetical protein